MSESQGKTPVNWHTPVRKKENTKRKANGCVYALLSACFQLMEKMCLKETNIQTVHPDSHRVLMWTSLPQHWLGRLLLVTVISLATTWSVHCGPCRGIYASHPAFPLIIMMEGLTFKVQGLCHVPPQEWGYPHRANWREAWEHSEKYHSFWTIQTAASALHLEFIWMAKGNSGCCGHGESRYPLPSTASEEICLRSLSPELASPHL